MDLYTNKNAADLWMSTVCNIQQPKQKDDILLKNLCNLLT